MAKFRKGNMLAHLDECDRAFITTNSMVRKDGGLVMGRGIAMQVKNGFPGIEFDFGETVLKLNAHLGEYLLLRCNKYPKFSAFQVKYHWAEKASLPLIEASCKKLAMIAGLCPNETFFLNFPGIGNGQLSREEVLPFVELLPDSVVVWEYE